MGLSPLLVLHPEQAWWQGGTWKRSFPGETPPVAQTVVRSAGRVSALELLYTSCFVPGALTSFWGFPPRFEDRALLLCLLLN